MSLLSGIIKRFGTILATLALTLLILSFIQFPLASISGQSVIRPKEAHMRAFVNYQIAEHLKISVRSNSSLILYFLNLPTEQPIEPYLFNILNQEQLSSFLQEHSNQLFKKISLNANEELSFIVPYTQTLVLIANNPSSFHADFKYSIESVVPLVNPDYQPNLVIIFVIGIILAITDRIIKHTKSS